MQVVLRITIAVARCFGVAIAQQYGPQDSPQRVVLNITPDPATSIAVTWRNLGEYPDGKIQIAAEICRFALSLEKIASLRPHIFLDIFRNLKQIILNISNILRAYTADSYWQEA